MANTQLSKTLSTPTDGKKWTWSAWVKRGNLGSDQALFNAGGSGSPNVTIRFGYSSDDKIYVFYIAGGSMVWEFATNAEFRDTNGWYHIVVRYDSTQSSATDRLRVYVNGTQQTFSNSTNSSQNITPTMNSAVAHYIGNNNASNYFDGCMSHVHFADGQSLEPSVFGSTDSTTGEWKINTSPSFTLGTNGFTILKDGNTITDQSSNSNDFTSSGAGVTKTEDCPSNVFATLNYLNTNDADQTFSNGNTKQTVSGQWLGISSTIAVNSGKYYWEVKNSGGGNFGAGIGKEGVNGTSTKYFSTNNNWLFDQSANYGYYRNGSGTQKANNNSASTYGTTIASNDILMIAWDNDNGKIYTGRNGSWFDSSDPANGTNPMYTITTGDNYWLPIFVSENNNIQVNFGNGYFGTTAVSSAGTNASNLGIFEYDVPTGFTALCTKGLNE